MDNKISKNVSKELEEFEPATNLKPLKALKNLNNDEDTENFSLPNS